MTQFNKFARARHKVQSFVEDNSPLREAPGPLPRVLKRGWIPGLRASLPSTKGFLRLTSVATPADLLVTSMAAEPFSIYVLAHVQALAELEVQSFFLYIYTYLLDNL